MKFLLYSDTHISEKFALVGANHRCGDGHNSRRQSLVDTERFFSWLQELAQEIQPDCIFHLGDLFDRHRPTPDEILVAFNGIEPLTWCAHYLLTGNHDSPLGAGSEATALVAAHLQDVGRVIARPAKEQIGDVMFYFLPYPRSGGVFARTDEDWSATKHDKNSAVSSGLNTIVAEMAADARQSEQTTILLAHVTFQGAKFNESQTAPLSDVQVTHEHLESFDFVFSGHIHKHQAIGGHPRGWYVPPPDRWEFGDEDGFRGIAILDTETGEVEWREYPRARKFITRSPREILAMDSDLPPAAFHLIRDAFIRVKGEVNSIEDYDAVQDSINMISSNVTAVRNDVVMRRQRDRVEAVDPALGVGAIFDAFIESRPGEIPEDRRDDVLEMAKQLVEQCKTT